MLLFLSFLGVVGFPITPAFLGEDLLLFHISAQHGWMVAVVAAAFVLNGIAMTGLFLRLSIGRPVEVRDLNDSPVSTEGVVEREPFRVVK